MEAKIRELFTKYATNHYFAGVGLVKRGAETIFADAYGYAHRAWKIPNTLSTRFDTASITKLFTTVGIFQLVDRGQLRLEDRILDILNLQGTEIPGEVTVYHLLNHISGIADDADEEAGEDYEEIWRTKPNYSVREAEDFLPQFVHKKPNFPPGTGHRYNNVAYILLGLAIERITGMKYRDYTVQNIFQPAGMTSTEFCAFDGIHENIAEGYVMIQGEQGECLGWRKNIYSYPPIGFADGGAYTTVGDLDQFIRTLYTGKLLSAKLTKELFTPQILVQENEHFKEMDSYGFAYIDDKEHNQIYFCKTGSNAGVACMFSYFPEIDTTIAILANQTSNVWKLNREVRLTLSL